MGESNKDETIEMQVKGLMLDPVSEAPIVVLQDPESERFLPIWIGVPEANAIAMVLEEISVPRPMTHDLYTSTLHALGMTIDSIQVHDLVENTFYARIQILHAGEEHSIDARPSDAIAIALRAGATIRVSETVLENAKANPLVDNLSEDEKIKEILKSLDEEDLGDYTM